VRAADERGVSSPPPPPTLTSKGRSPAAKTDGGSFRVRRKRRRFPWFPASSPNGRSRRESMTRERRREREVATEERLRQRKWPDLRRTRPRREAAGALLSRFHCSPPFTTTAPRQPVPTNVVVPPRRRRLYRSSFFFPRRRRPPFQPRSLSASPPSFLRLSQPFWPSNEL
jgi:hypothetical protein